MDCCTLFVTGIDKMALETQVFDYFRLFSGDVIKAELVNSYIKGQQNAIIHFSKEDSIQDVIAALNFTVVDGHLLKCHLNNIQVRKAIHNEKANVAIHFPKKYNMDLLTERFIFNVMKVHGQIINIAIRKDLRIALCHYVEEESAINAIHSHCDCGVKILPKTVRTQGANTKKYSPYSTKEKDPQIWQFKHSDFPSFDEIEKKINKPPKLRKLQIQKTNSSLAIENHNKQLKIDEKANLIQQ